MLYQIVVYTLYRSFGLLGVTLLKISLITIALIFLIRTLRKKRCPETGVFCGALIVFSACSAGWTERVDLISIMIVSILFYTLERMRQDGMRLRLFPLWLGIFFIWANMHAGCLIGLILISLYTIDYVRTRQLHWLKPQWTFAFFCRNMLESIRHLVLETNVLFFIQNSGRRAKRIPTSAVQLYAGLLDGTDPAFLVLFRWVQINNASIGLSYV